MTDTITELTRFTYRGYRVKLRQTRWHVFFYPLGGGCLETWRRTYTTAKNARRAINHKLDKKGQSA